MRRHAKGQRGLKNLRNSVFKIGIAIECLEVRRLLSDVSFDPPVSSPLPSGFQCQTLLASTPNNDGDYSDNLIATSSSGGGLWLESNYTGSYTVKEQLNTTATILGFTRANLGSQTIQGQTQNFVATGVFTTAGMMLQQSDSTFAAPNGLNYPSDAVQGAFAIGDFDSTDHLQNADLAVERFTPNAGTPGRGALVIAVFPLRVDGTLGPEIDTTLTTDGVPDAGSEPLATADFNKDGNLDIVAGGTVWLGEGDGTFDAANPIVLPVSTTVGSYVADDFNSDVRTDLAFLPSSGPTTGTAQILVNHLGNVNGTFTTDGSAVLGSTGTTNGVLIAADFTMDQTNDLASDIVSGSQAPAVSIAPNIGTAEFFSPDVVPTPGFEPQVSVDFSVDSRPDLVGISSLGGKFSIVSLESTTVAGQVIRLSVTPNPSIAGQSITLSASVSNPGYLFSSGTMTFIDGSTLLGQAPIDNGIAFFVTSKLSAGTHILTAGGSAPVIQTVNAAPINAPLLSAEQLARISPGWLVPGQKDKLRLDITNLGGAAASTTLSVKLFATRQGSIDSSSILIPVSTLKSRTVHVSARGKATLTGDYTMPENISAGIYYLAAQVIPIDGLAGSQLLNSTVVYTAPLTVVWEFGDVNGRKNVAMVRHLANGQAVSFKLTGAGMGTVSEGGGTVSLGAENPDYEVIVQNTDSHDTLSITQAGGRASNIASLTLLSDLGTCDVRTDTPQTIDTTGTLIHVESNFESMTRLLMGDIPVGTSVGSSTAGQITIDGHVGLLSTGALNGANVTIGFSNDKDPIQVKVATISSGSQVIIKTLNSSLEVGMAEAGSAITAPNIEKLDCHGNFSSNLQITGTTKGAQVLGPVAITGGVIGTPLSPVRWAVNGNIGKVHIGANVGNLQILGGAQLGPAGELTSPPASYSGTDIQSFEVGGSVTSSLISAGLDPVDGVLLDGNDTLLSGGAIGSIVIKGLASNDSRFLASELPTNAKIDSATVITAQDPRFSLT